MRRGDALGVGPRAARRDLHHLDPGSSQHRVEGLGELPARSLIRNRNPAAHSPRPISRFRACCTVHGPSGCAVTPGTWTQRDQPPVPAKQRVGRHQPPQPQRPWQRPGQGGKYRRVGASPALAWGSGAAAPPPRDAAPAARRPSTTPTVPATPTTRPGGRTSDTASVPSQADDAASPPAIMDGVLTGQLTMPRFGTPQARSERASKASQPNIRSSAR
jgi:hypothetical protein